MTSKTEAPAAGAAEAPSVKPTEQKRLDRTREAVRKGVQDERAGQGGSYVLDPSTGKRVLKSKPPEPRA